MPLVYIEKQLDIVTHTTKPQGRSRRSINLRTTANSPTLEQIGCRPQRRYALLPWSLDLAQEPFVLSIPEMGNRFWLMQLIDAWNNVPHAPGSRTVVARVATLPSSARTGKERCLRA